MGQKVNPHGLRVGVIKDWDSRWFAKDNVFGDTLVEDYNLRKTLKKQLAAAGVPKIEIERDASKVRVHIHCAKPGMVIGKGGAEIEKLRLQCEKMLGKPVAINIVEVKIPGFERSAGCREHCTAAGKENFFPPRDEAVHRPRHEARRQGYQDPGFRPSGRCRNRQNRAVSRRNHSAADPARGHRLRLCRGSHHLWPHRR